MYTHLYTSVWIYGHIHIHYIHRKTYIHTYMDPATKTHTQKYRYSFRRTNFTHKHLFCHKHLQKHPFTLSTKYKQVSVINTLLVKKKKIETKKNTWKNTNKTQTKTARHHNECHYTNHINHIYTAESPPPSLTPPTHIHSPSPPPPPLPHLPPSHLLLLTVFCFLRLK